MSEVVSAHDVAQCTHDSHEGGGERGEEGGGVQQAWQEALLHPLELSLEVKFSPG